MNSTVSGNTPLLATAASDTGSRELSLARNIQSVNNQRVWSTEQDGPNDKTVDIWYNGKWVPAYFKDILKGDFFLMIGLDLEPGRCFLAGSDARTCGRSVTGHMTYIIPQGMEIVQAPALKDIPADTLPQPAVPLLIEKE